MAIDRGQGIAISTDLAESYDLGTLIEDAEAAKDAAELALANIGDSETNAAASATAAAASAGSASSSADSASLASSSASASETAAELAETNAETAETNAELAETNAELAETHAETAQTAAESAQTSATASQASATASAASATASATSASSSATDAQSSEDDAATSENNASTSATSAANSATASATSATASSSSATNAATSATTATTKASEASTSASGASTSATSASTSASTATTQAGIATTKASEASTSATNAATSLSTFQGQYVSQATAPTSPTIGDLWFDTTASIMKVYTGTSFANAGSSVNGVENSVEHTATAGQTSFTATYDVGYLNVFLNGVKLDSTDYTATDGSNVVLDTGATVGDSVFVQSFGTFALADMYTKTASDARYEPIDSAYTKAESDAAYEPIDATILKDADIGTTVLSPTGDGSQLTGIDALPSQATHAGKYLGTDGTDATWNTLDTDANSTTKGLYEHANTISANYTIATGNNALTAGPITINTGVSVTVPTGSTWVIA